MNYLRNALSRPYIYLLVFSAVFGTVFFLTSRYEMAAQWLRQLFAGISTATLGSYLTIVLVDQRFRRQEKERRKRMRTAALRQMNTMVNRHLGLLGDMYVAASMEYPESPPSTYSEFFNGDFEQTVQLLDFSKEYPTARDSVKYTWFDWSKKELTQLNDALDKAISQYGAWLDPELVEKLQQIKDSQFSQMLITASEANTMQLDQEMGHDRVYTILLNHGDMIQDHTDAVLEVVQMYDGNPELELTDVEGLGVWTDNTTPKVGSALVDPEELAGAMEQE